MMRICPLVEVHDAAPGVPHSHAVGEVVRGEAVEVEHGPALESHPKVETPRLDARDVAEAPHERPAEADLALPVGDLDPEDLNLAALLELFGRRVGSPGILVLEAVEVVAPERLLVAPPAQPPLVGGAVIGGDAAVEEALVDLSCLRGRGGHRGRGRRGGVDVQLGCPVAGGEGEEDEHGGERPARDRGSRHGQLQQVTSTVSLPTPLGPVGDCFMQCTLSYKVNDVKQESPNR